MKVQLQNPLCDFAHQFPHLAAGILHRDRHKRRNFREESVTDLLMARATPGCVSMYMFYHAKDALEREDIKQKLPAVEGVNVIFAHHLCPVLTTNPPKVGNGRWSRTDKALVTWRPWFMSLSVLLCFGPGQFGFRLPSNPEAAFLLVPQAGSFSPGSLADRLEELRKAQSSADKLDEAGPIEAIGTIPDETMYAIRLRRDGVSAEVKRPRAIFYSGG